MNERPIALLGVSVPSYADPTEDARADRRRVARGHDRYHCDAGPDDVEILDVELATREALSPLLEPSRRAPNASTVLTVEENPLFVPER